MSREGAVAVASGWSLAAAAILAVAGAAAGLQAQAGPLVVDIHPGGLLVPDPTQGSTDHGLLIAASGWGISFHADAMQYGTCRAHGLDCRPVNLQVEREDVVGTWSRTLYTSSDVPVLEIEQQILPLPAAPGAVAGPLQVTVTLRNVAGQTLQDMQYRSVWKFAVGASTEHDDGHQLVDIRAIHPVQYTSTHGNARVQPLDPPDVPSGTAASPRYPDTCNGFALGPGSLSQGAAVERHGPCNNGFLAQVAFGDLPAGATRHVQLFLDVADDPGKAHASMAAHADTWAAAYPPTGGTTVAVGIRPVYVPPEAAFTIEASLPDPLPPEWSPGSACIGHPVTFLDSSRASSGLAGAEWNHGDGTTRSLAPWSATHDHAYTQEGNHNVVLSVVDHLRATAQTQRVLRVVDCGFVPVPSVAATPVVASCSEWRVRLDASASYDPDGQVTSHTWTIGSTTLSGATQEVDLMGHSSVVRLSVTDDDGKRASIQKTIVRPVSCVADPDSDGDGVADSIDNCRYVPNAVQTDGDGDQVGDMCDAATSPVEDDSATTRVSTFPDIDGDGIADFADNCVAVANRQQEDMDRDGLGDVCDKDLDGDGIVQTSDDGAYLDNCPYVPNPLQTDENRDGTGDKCQDVPATVLGDAPPRNAPFAGSTVDLSSPSAPGWLLATAGAALVASAFVLPKAWRRWTPFLAVGFSRLTGSQVEEHPVRQRILQVLQEKPGLHFHAIVREVGKGRGTVRHHLDVLTRSGHVRAHAAKGFTAFYPGGARIHNVEARTALQSPLAWKILHAACQTPGSSVSELARAVGSRHGTVHHHVQRLRDLGLLEAQEAGRSRALYPSTRGLEILTTADVARGGILVEAE